MSPRHHKAKAAKGQTKAVVDTLWGMSEIFKWAILLLLV